MISFAFLIAKKDLKLLFRGGAPLVQAILLGLLLIFLFSLANNPGEIPSPGQAATIFWLSSSFCQILIFNQLYALEEDNSPKDNLFLAPYPPQGIWLGKACAGFLLVFMAQIIFLPAIVVFLGQNLSGPILPGLAALALVDLGICALGSLLGAIGQGQSGRESLLSIILFPLLVPLLMAGASLGAQTLGADASVDATRWLGIAAAFDAMFIGAALPLFPYLYMGGE